MRLLRQDKKGFKNSEVDSLITMVWRSLWKTIHVKPLSKRLRTSQFIITLHLRNLVVQFFNWKLFEFDIRGIDKLPEKCQPDVENNRYYNSLDYISLYQIIKPHKRYYLWLNPNRCFNNTICVITFFSVFIRCRFWYSYYTTSRSYFKICSLLFISIFLRRYLRQCLSKWY